MHSRENLKLFLLMFGIVMAMVSLTVHAETDKKKKLEYYRFNSTAITSAFSGRTIFTVNKRTNDEIRTYFAEDGTVKQSIYPEETRRTGKWHAANNQLCLHWDGKDSEFCFDSVLQYGDYLYLMKDGKIETIAKDFVEGDDTLF